MHRFVFHSLIILTIVLPSSTFAQTLGGYGLSDVNQPNSIVITPDNTDYNYAELSEATEGFEDMKAQASQQRENLQKQIEQNNDALARQQLQQITGQSIAQNQYDDADLSTDDGTQGAQTEAQTADTSMGGILSVEPKENEGYGGSSGAENPTLGGILAP